MSPPRRAAVALTSSVVSMVARAHRYSNAEFVVNLLLKEIIVVEIPGY